MARSPLTESIQKVRRLVTEIQGTLTVDEFNLLLDELVPEPEPEVKQAKKTTARKIERCEVCNYTRRALQHINPQHTDYHEFVEPQKASKKSSKKSARASSLGAAVKDGLRRREPTVGGFADDADMVRCTAMIDDNGGEMECGETIDNNVHHKRTDPNYHPFVPSTTAPPAPAPSSANGGVGSITQNSEASAASAGVVTGGSNE